MFHSITGSMDIYKTYKHNPPHLFRPRAKYFITGVIYHKQKLLQSASAKHKLIHSIHLGFNSRGWKLEEWVVLHNHYHIMAEAPQRADTLPFIIQDVHKFSAMWMKKYVKEAKRLLRIWWNYWDTCITYEKSYFARLNYLWYNPQKHALISQAENWKFGSLYYRIQNNKEYVSRLRTEYPFNLVKVKDDF